MCDEGPERMLTRSKSALAELAPEHPWHPWALVVNGTAHLLLGDQDQADRAFAGAAAVSDQPESHSLALSERSLLAAGRDDDLAEGLALEAHRLIEEGQLDGYATSALDFAATARALAPPRPVGRGAPAADGHPAVGAERSRTRSRGSRCRCGSSSATPT